MKNKFCILKYSFGITSVFLSPTTHSEVLELGSIQDITPLIDKKTFVAFDIDNTLITTNQSLGSSEWYDYQYRQYFEKGISSAKSHKKAQALWKQINEFSEMSLVETDTAKFVENLQNKGISVIALTARPNDIYSLTEKQLKIQNINFSITAVAPKSNHIRIAALSEYTHGILFSDEQNKGEILLKFFKRFNISPTHVVFIDDVKKNADDVDHALSKNGIDVKSIYYTALIERVKNFDSKITDIESEIFTKTRKIISDSDAKKILLKNPNLP